MSGDSYAPRPLLWLFIQFVVVTVIIFLSPANGWIGWSRDAWTIVVLGIYGLLEVNLVLRLILLTMDRMDKSAQS